MRIISPTVTVELDSRDTELMRRALRHYESHTTDRELFLLLGSLFEGADCWTLTATKAVDDLDDEEDA